MKTAILYARVATADQCAGDHNPLQKQIDELKTFCLLNKIEVVDIYFEVAQGATFERGRFQEMLSDLESGMVSADVILFTSWDRFSRNYSAALKMTKTLRGLNTKARSIQDTEFSQIHLSF